MDRAQGNRAKPSPDVPTGVPKTERGEAGKRCVLSIAGLDNTAGAGVLADIKTFELFDLYGLGVPTAITVQTPDSVLEVSCSSAGRMRRSLEAMLGSCKVLGIKTGLLCDEAAIDVLSSVLSTRFEGVLVVDPVLHSSAGKQLITPRGRLAMSEKLFLMADVITPNIDQPTNQRRKCPLQQRSVLTSKQRDGPEIRFLPLA